MPSRLPTLVGLVLLLATAGGCKEDRATTSPIAISKLKQTSTEQPKVHELIDAMRTGQLEGVRGSMTVELRSRVRLADLQAASSRLTEQFGEPRGIIEERTHREGDLSWYSGLVLYSLGGVEGVHAPVLYQFALTQSGQIARMLVREHWFLQTVRPPAEHYLPVTRFHFPSTGEWYVLHGGRTRATNYHHGHKNQRYAYDLVVRKGGRQRPRGTSKKDNGAYYCHGKNILAPGPGIIIKAINTVSENTPGERGQRGGNGVVIDHGFGEYTAIWHAVRGSLKVREGDRVEPGQVIGKVGNSGRSTLPHIHIHMTYGTGGKEKFALPAGFVDVFVDKRWHPDRMPVRGQFVQRAIEKAKPAKTAAGPRLILDL